MSVSQQLRCAIYTRVSSDQGLEQDFNSLDAQREAAEAYIKSQANEGWKLIRGHFDDGGFSGGSMERPALQQLLNLVRDGRVDVIVVYKVDRLTRSLADFAKLVELFDAHKVSFVSVTQSFNTTSSMGRLTLNVLLSFAQFEREVTGERIRDKIAASKRKGIWMGGIVPLGYRVENRKLLVEESETKTVKLIFDLYLQLGSIPAVQKELRARSIVSRSRCLANGKVLGGVPFSNGAVSHILNNRHYIAELNHHGKSWPGEHQPIIESQIFEAVHQRLALQKQRRSKHVVASGALLIGKIFSDAGEPMSPNYIIKQRRRYRYYLSRTIVQGGKQDPIAVGRIPAEPVEALVVEALKAKLIETKKVAPDIEASNNGLITKYLERIIVGPNSIRLQLHRSQENDELAQTIMIPWTKPSSVRRKDIIMPEAPSSKLQPIRGNEQERLLRAIGLARRWLNELVDGTMPDIETIAKREAKTERSIRMTLSLGFLCPALVKAACEGRLPRGYGASRLVDLPSNFDQQWQALGLTRPA